jgi:hypothetical protein
VQHRQIAPHGHAVDRSTVRQKKTGQPAKFEMTEQTREAIDNYIVAAKRQSGEFLFGGRPGRDRPITTRQYARPVGQWIAGIGLDRRFFGTHSLRRTKATLIYVGSAAYEQYSCYCDTRRSRARCAPLGLAEPLIWMVVLVGPPTSKYRMRRPSTARTPGSR